ncbi:MAG: tetratricopeptide repeat protein, partial [Akkermansiaceae bacterium]
MSNAIERPSEAEEVIDALKEANFAKWYFGGKQETADDQKDLGDIYLIGMGALRKKVANVLGSYYSGNVIQKDYVEAVKWYRKAAEQGHAIAQYNLGCSYASGKGVTQDDVEAVKWYRKADLQGQAIAQTIKRSIYDCGGGV